jgi:predicted  nucleic acid-binding Zn-ribbon protein
VAPVKERLARNQKRVHDGSLDAKALTSAISEIAHLKARITKLEDQELEAMEAQEAAEAQLAKATQEAAAVEESLRQALAERESVVAEARQEMKGHRAARAAVLEDLPDDLVALYDRLRARYHGVGAARLEGHRCTGCGLEATTADYNRYVAAAPDELLRCTECDRILVRAV